VPNERVLEDCLRKEADRISNQGALMNRLVYDSVEPSPLYDKQRDNLKPDSNLEVKIFSKDSKKVIDPQESIEANLNIDPLKKFDIEFQIE